jgi:hypothetical protein
MTPTQTESFVPLTSPSPRAAGERLAFQATVIAEPGAAQKLQAFTPAVVSSATSAAAPAPQPQAACEPKVSVQREGNRVTGIQILCSCGQVIDLACVYEAAAPQAAAAAPEPATIPQPEPEAAAPGKICKDSGKDLPASAKKKPKKA